MSMYPRLLGIAAVVFGCGLSEALPAGDVWKGSWKFEIDRRDNPMLAYYDTSGRTIFRIYCGTHFETDAVYPGAAPKEDHTPASITIANGKTQMDFAGFTYLLDGPGSGAGRRTPRCLTRRTLATPATIPSFTKINGTR